VDDGWEGYQSIFGSVSGVSKVVVIAPITVSDGDRADVVVDELALEFESKVPFSASSPSIWVWRAVKPATFAITSATAHVYRMRCIMKLLRDWYIEKFKSGNVS
jgi:hypothetical protein